MWGAIPQETARSSRLGEQGPSIGMELNPRVGLPTAMNSMELLSLYDPSGENGLFFADVEGDLDRDIAPLQFTLSNDRASGYWVTELPPGGTAAIPTFAIGVHDTGDWHRAVDYYLKQHRPHWRFRNPGPGFAIKVRSTVWERAEGNLLGVSDPKSEDAHRVVSKPSQLLEEAESLGNHVFSLSDYGEGASEGGRPAYWNKGDYLPRCDMGGELAFREGIRCVHQQGDADPIRRTVRHLLLLPHREREGAIVGRTGCPRQLLQRLPAKLFDGGAFRPWQDYLVGIVERLVRDYGADGIFLDSWAWQMNRPMQTEAEHVLYTPKQYSQGVLAIADRVGRPFRP